MSGRLLAWLDEWRWSVLACVVSLVLLALVRRAADERMRRLADGLLTFAALDLIVHIAVAILVSQSTPGVPVGALLTVAIFWRVAGTALSIWAARQSATPEVL